MPEEIRGMRPVRRRSYRWLVFAILCGGVAGAAYHYRDTLKRIYAERTKPASSKVKQIASSHLVSRGDLTVSVLESGEIKAVRSIQIASEVEGQARIINIVPEGSLVKEGDLLVELDSSDFEDRINQQEITVESAKATLTEAQENLEIQKNQNRSDIKAAELKVKFAKVDLKKYLQGDWPQQKRSAGAAITIAEEELKRANDRLKWTQKLEKEGFVTRSELEADQLSVKKAELKLEEARESLHILEEYENPKKEEQLAAAVEETDQELGRVKHKASAQILQKEASLRAHEATYKLQVQKLDKLKEQKARCRICAPAPGLVVYYAESRRFRASESAIEEGAVVRERQKIITLPDVSKMRVDVKVHESAVDKVSQGQKVYVTVDALPGKRFLAHVKSVALVSDSQSSYLNPDLKVYSTVVVIDSDASMLKPGMSASVEIIVAELKEVISVPIQAVVSDQGQPCCYVPRGDHVELRAIRIGLANDEYVVLEEGIEPGERVLLYAPEPTAKVRKVGFDRIQSGPETVAVVAPLSDGAGSGASEKGEKISARPPEGPSAGGGERAGTGRDRGSDWSERMRNMNPEEREAARKRFEERMKNMTPEEREQMQQRRQRRGRPDGAGPGRGGGGGEAGETGEQRGRE